MRSRAIIRVVGSHAEQALALLAAVVGLVGVGSALTPELARRADLVSGILPPGLPTAGRVVAIAFGVGLIWLSRGLAARKRRAWQLAVALLVGIALAHLVKGLDFEEALLSLLFLWLLLLTRRRFDVPGDPLAILPLSLTLVALGLVATPRVLVEFGVLSVPERVNELLWTLTVLLTAFCLQLWLRPWRERRQGSAAERAVAREIVAEHGVDSLDFFALRHDKSYFFSADRSAFVAYRVIAGCALIGGDPVGEEAEFQELLERFREYARGRGWRIGVLAASETRLPLYQTLGLRALKLGDEAIVRASSFSLEGRAIRKVRQSVSRLEREGYQLRVLRERELTPKLRVDLEQVSNEWRGDAPERGFAMAMDRLFGDPETVFVVALDRAGEIGGFLHLVPTANQQGYSLSAMRRRPNTPNGLMEYLIVSALGWMNDSDLDELSLNFCAFADILRADHESHPGSRVLKRVLVGLDRAFQLDRLLHFNNKFSPEWRPRYLLLERATDFPRIGLACLLAESLLTPPGAWNRTTDPAAAVSARPL